MELEYRLHFSGRGVPLVWVTRPLRDRAVLTVENYTKWYSLFLIHPNGAVEEVPFPDDKWARGNESAFCDHVPNPNAVQRFAADKGYGIDDQAYEMMVGRWELEVVDSAGTKYESPEVGE